jgi:hypothetical protein
MKLVIFVLNVVVGFEAQRLCFPSREIKPTSLAFIQYIAKCDKMWLQYLGCSRLTIEVDY